MIEKTSLPALKWVEKLENLIEKFRANKRHYIDVYESFLEMATDPANGKTLVARLATVHEWILPRDMSEGRCGGLAGRCNTDRELAWKEIANYIEMTNNEYKLIG